MSKNPSEGIILPPPENETAKLASPQSDKIDNERVDYIDLIKGITILGVIWVHTDCFPITTLVNTIFFFISGIFFKTSDFRSFFIKKWKTLLLPFLFFYFASVPFRYIVNYWDFRTLSAFDWHHIFDLFVVSARSDYLYVNVPLWFLLSLFVMQALANVLFRLPKWAVLVIAIASFCMRELLLSWRTMFLINHSLYWFSYFAFGYLKGKPLINYLKNIKQRIMILCISLFFIIGCLVLDQLWLDMPPFLTCVKYLIIPVFLMALFASLNGNRYFSPLRYYGNNSLYVLGTHLWILIPVSRISYRLTGIHHPMLGLVLAVITAILLVPLINFIRKYMPFGSKKALSAHSK
jgi:fucose 4-O-acetylase-like acetyltransferase